MQTIILADGEFPKNENLLRLLRESGRVICCDGAAQKLHAFGRKPDAIVGDIDSIPDDLEVLYRDIIFPSEDQETNDLTKAIEYCQMNNYQDIVILGATGLREDHTLGNISLLAEYALKIENICMLTDYGRMDAIHKSTNFACLPGQQISIFSLTPDTQITAHGLLYPIENRNFTSWWQGTLNQTTGDNFRIEMDRGRLLVYQFGK